jgi:phospholipase A1
MKRISSVGLQSVLALLFVAYSSYATAEKLEGEELLKKRAKEESKVEDNPFVIMPHRANYLLPLTYSSDPNDAPFADDLTSGNKDLDNLEAKFQISVKMPLAENLFGDNGALFFAYTNQSWWQVYNQRSSAPFRETVHEPEFFLAFKNDWSLGGFENQYWAVGVNHQSNGQAGTLSRSWNRIYGNMIFDNGPLVFSAQAWWRIPESEKTSTDDATGDDNPDIGKYMGNFELQGLYGLGEHRFTAMVRNNLRIHDNKGALQLTYSYPIHKNLRLYMQYFNGYGESLIDYNAHIERLGIGIALNDLL